MIARFKLACGERDRLTFRKCARQSESKVGTVCRNAEIAVG
jgi:hypothetical protein